MNSYNVVTNANDKSVIERSMKYFNLKVQKFILFAISI